MSAELKSPEAMAAETVDKFKEQVNACRCPTGFPDDGKHVQPCPLATLSEQKAPVKEEAQAKKSTRKRGARKGKTRAKVTRRREAMTTEFESLTAKITALRDQAQDTLDRLNKALAELNRKDK